MVSTFKLHLLEFLLDVLLDTDKLGLFALHRTHASLIVKFLKAFMMVPVFARFAFNGVNQNCLT